MAHSIIKGWKFRCNYGTTFNCANCKKEIRNKDTYWSYYDSEYCNGCGGKSHKSISMTASIVKAVKTPTTQPKYGYHKGTFTRHATPVNCDDCGLLINSHGSTYWFKGGGNPAGTSPHLICNPCYMKKLAPQTPVDWEPYVIYGLVTCNACKTKILRNENSYRKVDQQAQVMIFRHKSCHEKLTGVVLATNIPIFPPTFAWTTFTLLHSGSCGKCLKVYHAGTMVMRRPTFVPGNYEVRCMPCHFSGVKVPMAGILPAWFRQNDKEDDEAAPAETIDVGTAPTKVQCACFGMPHYKERVEREVEVWIPYLKVLFGEPPVGCSFKQASIIDEGGCEEITVKLYYRPDYETCVAYADKVNTGLPARWKETKDSDNDDTPEKKVRIPMCGNEEKTREVVNELVGEITPELEELYKEEALRLASKEQASARDRRRRELGKVMSRVNKEDGSKLGRNDKCLCGSGKKFKKCGCWELLNG